MRYAPFILALLTAPAFGQESYDPNDMRLEAVIARAEAGDLDMMTCASGYFVTKAGNHADARKIFEPCAEAGYTAAMIWMAQMEANGLGGPKDLKAATNWERRAAEAGDALGQYNFGLSLLAGRGVPRDTMGGRAMIDAAAAAGVEEAETVRAAGYDPSASPAWVE